MSELTFEEAEARLGAAIEQDQNSGTPMFSENREPVFAAPEPAPAAPSNVPASAPQGPPPGATPSAEPMAPAIEDTFVDRADLEALLEGVTDPVARERIDKAYKSFQAGFTRKTQEAAPYRKLADETGLDPEALQTAASLYQRLRDPYQWPELHQELSNWMDQLGLLPQEGGEYEYEAPEYEPDLSGMEDPELQPLHQHISGLHAEVDSLKAELYAARERERQEAYELAMLNEFNRQETAIRTSNPTYGDPDLDAVYEMAAYHDNNLLKAQQRLEEYVGYRIERYLEGKRGAAEGLGPVAPSASPITQPVTGSPTTLEDAEKIALERINQIDALDL